MFDENGLVLGITSATWDEGQNLNLAIRSTVAAAMYGSWDGNVFDLNKAPKNSPVNFSMIDSASALVVGITPLPETTEWICADCGNKNNTLFCVNCGKARPEWICVCGQTNISMFCGHCGQSVRSLVDIFNEACQDLQAERFEQALRSFSSLERFDSKTYETTAGKNANASEFARHCHYLLGGYLLGQNRFDDAISQYRLAGTTWLDTAVCIQRAYYLQGTALLDEERYTEAIEVFSQCDRFSDAEERIQSAYYQLGVQQYNAGQYETAAENFINAGAYSDAPQWLLKIDYTKAVAEGEKGLYKNAVKMLEKIADYPPATDKIKEYSFLIGEDAFERKEYAQAISFFIKADDYANASDLLKTTYDVFIRHHCRYGSYVTAYALWQEAAGYQIIFEDTVLFSPGINDDLVTGLLTLAKDMGFISSLPQKETVYAEKYTAAIIKMKAYFGLREDEFVRLSEMAYLSQIVYPNLSGRKVVPLLEKVKDLKYWTGSLPEDHSSYLLKYVEAVKSAETNLGLKADGFLTLEEQTVLLNQVTPTPKSVKKLTAKEINGGVKLSWGIADGAVAYDLYRNKTKIATVNGTSYTDDGFWVKSGYYTYHIIPHSYSMSARATYSERVYLGRR